LVLGKALLINILYSSENKHTLIFIEKVKICFITL
jgi:hypothetical protein